MLTERQGHLLEALIREYIRTAEPVASERLAARFRISASSATIRNEMAALEEAGFLSQPHTSAGRIPTEQGYRYYIEHCLSEGHGDKVPHERLRKLEHQAESDAELLKAAAKLLAQYTREAVFVGFSPQDVYYTGLSHLLHQPEFQEFARLASLTSILDQVEELMPKLYDQASNHLEIKLGSDNPFGVDCGTIMIKVRYGHRPTRAVLLGLVGPMRMDYERNRAILEAMAKHLQYG